MPVCCQLGDDFLERLGLRSYGISKTACLVPLVGHEIDVVAQALKI